MPPGGGPGAGIAALKDHAHQPPAIDTSNESNPLAPMINWL